MKKLSSSLCFGMLLFVLVNLMPSSLEAFPGSGVVLKLVSSFGDDACKVAKHVGTKLMKKGVKYGSKYGDDILKFASKYGDDFAQWAARLGRKERILLRSAEKKGVSAGKMRELVNFLGEKGEEGALFLERHWKLALSGTGIYALWENEQYRRSQGKAGLVDAVASGIGWVFNGFSRIFMAVIGLLAFSWVFKWLLPTCRYTPFFSSSKEDTSSSRAAK